MEASTMLPAVMAPTYLFLSFIVFGAILRTDRQIQRMLWLPVFLAFSILSLTAAKYFWFLPALRSIWTQSVTLYVLHAISVLFIEQWSIHMFHPVTRSPKSKKSHQIASTGWAWQLRATYRLWGNPRLYRIEHHITNRRGHASSNSNAEADQSLYSFVFLRSAKLLIYYYVHVYILPELFAETIVDIMPNDVGRTEQKLFRRLHDFSSREAVVRIHTSMYWIWESLVYLDGANSVLAIFFVLVGLDEPQDWPALFGSLSDATNLRRFWNCFWHRLATRPYCNYGRALAGGVLKLEPQSVHFNTIVALTVFTSSGVTHAITARQSGLRDWHLEICWFFLNFMGCSIERLLSSSLRTLAKKTGWHREWYEIENSWLGRLFGYFWVFAFFFWSVPKLKYPRMQQDAVFRQRHRDFMTKLQSFQDP